MKSSYNYNQTGIPQNKKWFEKQHKTVKAVCLECREESSVTLYGYPSTYRELIGEQPCMHCGVIGKLNTSELPKSRPKRIRLTLPLFK